MPDSIYFNFFKQNVLLNQFKTDTVKSNMSRHPIATIDVGNKKVYSLICP